MCQHKTTGRGHGSSTALSSALAYFSRTHPQTDPHLVDLVSKLIISSITTAYISQSQSSLLVKIARCQQLLKFVMAFVPSLPVGVQATSSHSLQFTRPLRYAARQPKVSRRLSCPNVQKVSSPVMQKTDVKTSEIFMPALSSTMSEGKIVQWLKRPGDRVSSGEPIMVVESDKADMDVESFEDGYLATILVEEGATCPVGQAVGILVRNKDDVGKVKVPASPSAATSSPPASSHSSDAAPPEPAATSAPKPAFMEVFMPALSSTMTDGKVVDWLKSEGDTVEQGDMIMVVESDKADMDVESFESGILAHILVPAGEFAPVGAAVAYLARSAAEVPAIKAWAASSSSSTVASAPVDATTATTATPSTPTASATTSASEAVKEVAKVINEGRIIASPLAKATAEREGIDLRYIQGTGPNGRIKEMDVLKAKAEGNGATSSTTGTAPASPDTPVAAAKPRAMFATPDAKKIAKKENVDLASITGTGNFGRITADDVLRAAGKAPVQEATVEPAVPSAGSPVAASSPGPTPEVKKAVAADMPAGAVAMNAMQKAVVQNMNASLTVPVFRITYTIRTTALDALYAKVKPKGVTMSALLAKAVALTLRKHPIMNAAYGEKSIVYRNEINIAMAVAMPDGGLITPTLMKADETDLYSLSRVWKDLVKRAGEKKLSPAEYSSGTFTISNLGMFGVDQFDAILPPGVPGILAVGASKPVVQLQSNGLVGVEKVMKVTLTGDHRHIYGADGAKFLQDLAALIENDVTELVM